MSSNKNKIFYWLKRRQTFFNVDKSKAMNIRINNGKHQNLIESNVKQTRTELELSIMV